ncbi:MAG: hypothetical protein RL701_1460 [Pseudomonadota bacterium]|jgi:hypothetical protein
MPAELVHEIRSIVHKEDYTILKDAFPLDKEPPIFLSKEEAEALITLAVIEKRKAWLRYPYYDEDHPLHSAEHEQKFDDIQMGIYEKTIYYVGTAFTPGTFDSLL